MRLPLPSLFKILISPDAVPALSRRAVSFGAGLAGVQLLQHNVKFPWSYGTGIVLMGIAFALITAEVVINLLQLLRAIQIYRTDRDIPIEVRRAVLSIGADRKVWGVTSSAVLLATSAPIVVMFCAQLAGWDVLGWLMSGVLAMALSVTAVAVIGQLRGPGPLETVVETSVDGRQHRVVLDIPLSAYKRSELVAALEASDNPGVITWWFDPTGYGTLRRQPINDPDTALLWAVDMEPTVRPLRLEAPWIRMFDSGGKESEEE